MKINLFFLTLIYAQSISLATFIPTNLSNAPMPPSLRTNVTLASRPSIPRNTTLGNAPSDPYRARDRGIDFEISHFHGALFRTQDQMDVLLFHTEDSLLCILGLGLSGLKLDYPIISGRYHYADVGIGMQMELFAVPGDCVFVYGHVAGVVNWLFGVVHESGFVLPEFTIEVSDPGIRGAMCLKGTVSRLP